MFSDSSRLVSSRLVSSRLVWSCFDSIRLDSTRLDSYSARKFRHYLRGHRRELTGADNLLKFSYGVAEGKRRQQREKEDKRLGEGREGGTERRIFILAGG